MTLVKTRGGYSSSKHHSTASRALATKRSCMASSPASSALSLPATASVAALASGMGFNSPPPLPVVSTIFGFLTSLNLRTVGLDLGVVPCVFGWDLVLFEVDGDQTVSEGVLESDTAQTRSVDVLESSGVLSRAKDSPGPVSKDVSDLGQTGTGPSPIFVESLHDPSVNLDRVGDIEKNDGDGSDTLIEII